MSAVELNDPAAVYRTARKAWRCTCVTDFWNRLARSAECVETIAPGDRYIEYVGEVSRYGQSGHRYCLPCGLKSWELTR